jgi:hypothetical protein
MAEFDLNTEARRTRRRTEIFGGWILDYGRSYRDAAARKRVRKSSFYGFAMQSNHEGAEENDEG